MKKQERFFVDVATKIKNAIREAGLTQRELAKMLGITQATVNSFTNGKHSPTAKTLKKIATATGKPMEYFFYNSGNIAAGNVQGGQGNIMINSTEMELLKKENELLKKENELLKKEIELLEKF